VIAIWSRAANPREVMLVHRTKPLDRGIPTSVVGVNLGEMSLRDSGSRE
jgi:hypothetical protein